MIMAKVLLPTLASFIFTGSEVCYAKSEKSVQKKEIIHAVSDRAEDGGKYTYSEYGMEYSRYMVFYMHKLTLE